jgi:hypothetical protein
MKNVDSSAKIHTKQLRNNFTERGANMARNKKEKRVELILRNWVDRDRIIWDELDKLNRTGGAGEWIRQTLYKALVNPPPEAIPATVADVQTLAALINARIADLQHQLMTLTLVDAPPDPLPEMGDEETQRQAVLSAKMKKISFKELTQ